MTHARKTITVRAEIKAAVDKVWQYWTQPDHIINWNFASNDWHCPEATNDLRKGGKFSSKMAARDGSMSFDFEGTFDEIELHKSLSYTIADGRKVKVSFEKDGNNTVITETFEMEQMNPEELQRSGWQSILDNFKKYAEQQKNAA